MATHYIEEMEVTGTQKSPQTVLFSSLTDKDENSLSFSSAPLVGIIACRQQRRANVIKNSVTATQFKIALSKIGIMGLSHYYFDLKIVG